MLKLPMLRAIKRAFGGHPIWWIANHSTAMAHELRPWVVGPLLEQVIENAGITVPWRQVIRRLRQFPAFEMVFDTRTRGFTVLLARTFLTHRGFYACLPGYVLSPHPPDRRRRPHSIGQRALSMVEAATGGAVDLDADLEPPAMAKQIAAELLPAGSAYIGLAPGSREAHKNWPMARFVALAQQLVEKGAKPVFLIGPQETGIRSDLRAAVPAALFPQLPQSGIAGGLRMLELDVAIGRRLAVAVANDSGIGHVLAAIGTPLVSLFGPTDARRWAPLASQGQILRAQDFGGEAMVAIPVEAVIGAVDRLLAQPVNRQPREC